MEMTGWLSGQVFLQTVDEGEVKAVSDFLNSRGIAYHVLTLSERMVVEPDNPDGTLTTDRFSIAIQIAGFPQVIGPIVGELLQRTHGAGWSLEGLPEQ